MTGWLGHLSRVTSPQFRSGFERKWRSWRRSRGMRSKLWKPLQDGSRADPEVKVANQLKDFSLPFNLFVLKYTWNGLSLAKILGNLLSCWKSRGDQHIGDNKSCTTSRALTLLLIQCWKTWQNSYCKIFHTKATSSAQPYQDFSSVMEKPIV